MSRPSNPMPRINSVKRTRRGSRETNGHLHPPWMILVYLYKPHPSHPNSSSLCGSVDFMLTPSTSMVQNTSPVPTPGLPNARSKPQSPTVPHTASPPLVQARSPPCGFHNQNFTVVKLPEVAHFLSKKPIGKRR